MTTWTMEQVRQVKGLRAAVHLDLELVDRSGGQAPIHAADKMVRKLIDMAHPFAVEPHPEDFDFIVERPAETPWAAILRCHWAPRTNAAILQGGPRDGERWAMQRIGDPFTVEWLTETPWLDTDATHAEAAIIPGRITYELTGWHEGERAWVYTPHP